jgi:probable rRNA maturation factor
MKQSLRFGFYATDAAKKLDPKWKKLEPLVKEAARCVLREELEEIGKLTLNVVLNSDEELREINIRSLNHDYYTDIITFEIDRDEHTLSAELYISSQRAQENARRFKASFRNELARLVIHGMLHLVGYGDKLAAEKKRMRRRERYFLQCVQKVISIE